MLTHSYLFFFPLLSADRLLLISLDGFSHKYLEMYPSETTNLQKLANIGLRSKYLTNQFITKTFPNHWTIVTGLYEESHGIINNFFYDPKYDEKFAYSTDPKFWSGEPIWKTLETQKPEKQAACFFWPGSEAIPPKNYIFPYDNSIAYKTRADKVLNWLRNEDISFSSLYVSEPDHSGHIYGPASEEVREAVERVNELVGYVLQEIQKHPEEYADLNVVVTSDHGMTGLSDDKVIYLKNCLPPSYFEEENQKYVLNYQSGAHIWCDKIKQSSCDEALEKLKSCADPNLIIYTKETIPDDYHYKNHYRIPPIVLDTKLGYQITLEAHPSDMMGTHGWAPGNDDMHPIFIAAGPKIKKFHKEVAPAFENVHLYSLFCEILGIKPAANNGSLASVEFLLNSKNYEFDWKSMENIMLKDNWTIQKVIGAACMLMGIAVGLR